MAITSERLKEMMKKRMAAKKNAAVVEEDKKEVETNVPSISEETASTEPEEVKETEVKPAENPIDKNTSEEVEPVKESGSDDEELNRLLNEIQKNTTVVNKATVCETTVTEDVEVETESASENTEAVAEEQVQETTAEEIKEEPSVAQEPVEEEQISVEEPVEEVKTAPEKKVRKSRKKKENVDELKAIAEKKETIQEVAQEIAENIIGTTCQNYTESVALLMSNYEDDEWLEFKKDIIDSMSSIQINADMNPGTLKYALMEINDVEAKLAVRLSEYEAVYAAMVGDYRDGLCNVIRSTNANGNNEEVRRQNGFRALAKVNMGGVDLNFIDIITATRIRLKFMQGIQRRLKSMSAICITMSGALKMEKDLLAG